MHDQVKPGELEVVGALRSWDTALAVPDWLAEAVEVSAQLLARSGRLQRPAVFRGEGADESEWWAVLITDPSPNEPDSLGLIVPLGTNAGEVLQEIPANWPGSWMFARIQVGGGPGGEQGYRASWEFVGKMLPQLRLDA